MKYSRIETIKNLIIEKKYLSLNELVQTLGASESTIRRDLQSLEREGILRRNHGGAIINENIDFSCEGGISIPINISNIAEKTAIGKKAAEFVEDGDFITIGAGTTCLVFARQLNNKHDVTILTNNLYVAVELSFNKNLQVIVTSGVADNINNCSSIMGDYVLQSIEEFRTSKVFCSVIGIDLKTGYSDLDLKISGIWRKMVEYSGRSFILADHTKFGKQGRVRIGDFNIVDEIITSNKIPEQYMHYYNKEKISIHTV